MYITLTIAGILYLLGIINCFLTLEREDEDLIDDVKEDKALLFWLLAILIVWPLATILDLVFLIQEEERINIKYNSKL